MPRSVLAPARIRKESPQGPSGEAEWLKCRRMTWMGKVMSRTTLRGSKGKVLRPTRSRQATSKHAASSMPICHERCPHGEVVEEACPQLLIPASADQSQGRLGLIVGPEIQGKGAQSRQTSTSTSTRSVEAGAYNTAVDYGIQGQSAESERWCQARSLAQGRRPQPRGRRQARKLEGVA